MFKKIILSSTLFISSFLLADERPNIVVILADDMGYTDIGCYGGEIETPNLNSLANEGLRFTQFYNTGRCCPTRASLLTGLYPHQAGIGHMMSDRGVDGYRGDLNKTSVTIAEVLKPAGYSTYMVGKWHVTPDQKSDKEDIQYNWPLNRGFDRFYGTIHGAGSFFDPNSLTRNNRYITPENDPEYQPDTYYYTDAISDNAVKYIKQHDQKKPFFMYVAYTAAHWPLHALPEDIAKYNDKYDQGYEPIRKARYEKANELGVIPHTEYTETLGNWNSIPDKQWESAQMEVYAAMVDRMDQGIGKIINTLKMTNQLDNTLILFMQDNGGCQEAYGRNPKGPRVERKLNSGPMARDEHQYDMTPKKSREGFPMRRGHVMPGPADTAIGYGLNWANVSNTPFRMYKHYVHEGGISTPLIAHWPKGITAKNELRHQPSHLIDIMSTCVEVAKADYPKEFNDENITPMEGMSLVPIFEGQGQRRPYLFWEHEGNRAVRIGDWKIVAKGRHGQENVPWELYNLANDRSEVHNLAKANPEKLESMIKSWTKQAERTLVTPWPKNPKQKKAKKKSQKKL
ncbi:arylsulfatase [Lentisphaera profundi]|uniref:Arylsulfatase n=1 Tax=Lentisphaera profundi TaxID=1658616 RepID=A0ABY7VMT1_9BACT|nr:arylsulfatase [Lentisphaera profundi]WDE95345.1 arylsulfatase [Lentisphaera profundi]